MQLRGHVLSPRPEGGLRWEPDSSVSWDDAGILRPAASGDEVLALDGAGADSLLLVPGLIDAHLHMPQYRVRGRFQEALLPWLRAHIWPEEARCADPAYEQEVAAEFRAGMLAAGTTAAMVFGAPHPASARTVLRDLEPVFVRGGDVLMDRNSPEALTRSTADCLATAASLAAEHADRYVLTPRFAPTCTPELLAGLGAIAAERSVRVQTHLAENLDEVAWVKDLHPESRSYTDVYDRAGLLGPRTVMAHCIHLDDRDLERLATTGTWVAHCPTSNVALGSGRMPIERMDAAGVSVALGTDVGAGPQLSMLDVMHTFLGVHAAFVSERPTRALELATLAGARAIGEESRRGALAVGRVADIVALRIPGGLRRHEGPDDALLRILETFAGRWEDAVGGVIASGRRPG